MAAHEFIPVGIVPRRVHNHNAVDLRGVEVPNPMFGIVMNEHHYPIKTKMIPQEAILVWVLVSVHIGIF